MSASIVLVETTSRAYALVLVERTHEIISVRVSTSAFIIIFFLLHVVWGKALTCSIVRAPLVLLSLL